jgi:hypothetical protein
MPYVVDCIGLTRNKLASPGEFEGELRDRREWLAENCRGQYEIKPLGPNPECLTGRRFVFEKEEDAARFKLFFPTHIEPGDRLATAQR